MPRVKKRTFFGVVCEQKVFTVSGRIQKLAGAQPPVPRFRTQEERQKHKEGMSRRHHEQMVNGNFNVESLYSTLTFDDENEVHTFAEARRVRDLYVRRLKYAFPDARIAIYMGRGKSTHRIHMHMISHHVPAEAIRARWTVGTVLHVKPLRAHNYYDGVDHGQDYTSLANYLFDHWTPEQGGHRWKQTKNMVQVQEEDTKEIRRTYSKEHPPIAPKGYMLVEAKGNEFGYQYFKYVLIPEKDTKKIKKKPPL